MADMARQKTKEAINESSLATDSEKKMMNGAVDLNKAAFDHVKNEASKDNTLSNDEKRILGTSSSKKNVPAKANKIESVSSTAGDVSSTVNDMKDYLEMRKQMKVMKAQKTQEKAQENEIERTQKEQFIKQLEGKLARTEEKQKQETEEKKKTKLGKDIAIQKAELQLKDFELEELDAKAQLNGGDFSKEQKKLFKERRKELEQELKTAKK